MKLIEKHLKSNKIFNALGPSTNTWHMCTAEKEKAISNKLNLNKNFYENLESSILDNGFKNPIIVNYGHVPSNIWDNPRSIPSHIRDKGMKQFICCVLGGSRLYVAQKYGLLIPVIINDFTNSLRGQFPTTDYTSLHPNLVFTDSDGLHLKYPVRP